MTVGERIKQVRELKGMSQDELAKKMGYKDRSSISKIEKSKNEDKIKLDAVQKIAEILNVSPLYLMGWDHIDSVPVSVDKETQEREEHFMQAYARLDAYQQKLVNSMIETFLSEQ